MRTPATEIPAPGSYIAHYLLTSLPSAIIYIPIFGILALIVGLNSRDIDLAFKIFFFGPAVLHAILTAIGQKRFKKKSEETWNKAWMSLDHVDYFHASTDEAIALDAEARKIAILKRATKKPNHLETLVIKFEDIKGYKYQVVNPVEFEAEGFYNPNHLIASTKNLAEKHKARKSTGIILVPNAITSIEYLVCMDEKTIKVWMKILESAFSGDLEPTDRPIDTAHI